MDYPEFNIDNGFIFFLDFCKAFDSVEHQFIFESLIKFGFRNFFTSAIKNLYKNSNSSIKLLGGTSTRFNLFRGIRRCKSHYVSCNSVFDRWVECGPY